MALVTSVSGVGRAFSIGPVKMQVVDFAVASADTNGTITFDQLATVDDIIINGVTLTAQPSISANVATVTFQTVITGGAVGTAIGLGK